MMITTIAEEKSVDRVEQFILEGDAHQKAGNTLKALQSYGQAFQLNPDSLKTVLKFGVALERLGEFKKAARVYEQALKRNPEAGELYNNLGNIYKTQGQLSRAIACYQKAVECGLSQPEPYSNLGSISQLQGNASEALDFFEKALTINPEHGPTRLNRALTWLYQGNFEKGWPEYEWRLQDSGNQRRKFDKPRWQGEPFEGKTLLVWVEQGYGDTIQFVRYLPMVKALGGKVILECQPALAPLLSSVQGLDGLYEKYYTDAPPFEYDVQVSLMSLPGIFQTDSTSIPSEIPYLAPEQKRYQCWKERFSPYKVNVGIIWGGSPSHRHDRYRSCQLKDFTVLDKLSYIQTFSLQKGERVKEFQEVQTNIINLDPDNKTFSDTAAIISALDLVITVDTSVAHIAGALGKPVWLLLSSGSDWRWGMNGSETPWYPTMRIFRQETPGKWKSVFRQIREELKILSKAELQQASVFNERDLITDQPPSLYELYAKAQDCLGRNQAQEAIKLCQDILSANSDYPYALNMLGVIATAAKQPKKAIPLLQKAISINSTESKFFQNLGNTYQLIGKEKEAEQCFCRAKCLTISP